MDIQTLKQEMIQIGRELWQKDLASGLNGNVSVRVDENRVLLTAHGTCLGRLSEKDILLVNPQGEVLEGGSVSTERLLHTSIYKNFPDIHAVLHTHTTYTNAYFLENETLSPRIFEAKFYLGEVRGIPQMTPSVTDMAPVIQVLRRTNVAVLRNHGVVAMGKTLFDCFLLIQALEDAAKVEIFSRLSRPVSVKETVSTGKTEIVQTEASEKKYKLFSREQMDSIVNLVNQDNQLADLGQKTNMTMDLAVKLNETGQTYSFRFQKGKIVELGSDENVEFLITAPENVWRAVFNREIDPFVATTQKKMHLRGDFAKISKWYAPCSRVFELWQQVPVE